MKYFKFIYWYMVYIPLVCFAIAIYIGYLRVSGDISICKLYYPEMNIAECFFSSKTVRIPNK